MAGTRPDRRLFDSTQLCTTVQHSTSHRASSRPSSPVQYSLASQSNRLGLDLYFYRYPGSAPHLVDFSSVSSAIFAATSATVIVLAPSTQLAILPDPGPITVKLAARHLTQRHRHHRLCYHFCSTSSFASTVVVTRSSLPPSSDIRERRPWKSTPVGMLRSER